MSWLSISSAEGMNGTVRIGDGASLPSCLQELLNAAPVIDFIVRLPHKVFWTGIVTSFFVQLYLFNVFIFSLILIFYGLLLILIIVTFDDFWTCCKGLRGHCWYCGARAVQFLAALCFAMGASALLLEGFSHGDVRLPQLPFGSKWWIWRRWPGI